MAYQYPQLFPHAELRMHWDDEREIRFTLGIKRRMAARIDSQHRQHARLDANDDDLDATRGAHRQLEKAIKWLWDCELGLGAY